MPTVTFKYLMATWVIVEGIFFVDFSLDLILLVIS